MNSDSTAKGAESISPEVASTVISKSCCRVLMSVGTADVPVIVGTPPPLQAARVMPMSVHDTSVHGADIEEGRNSRTSWLTPRISDLGSVEALER